jgi:hypothetical protein
MTPELMKEMSETFSYDDTVEENILRF